MTVQLNIQLEPEQKEILTELTKVGNKIITAYILDETIFAETAENEQEDTDTAITRISGDNSRVDNEQYKVLI